MNPKILIVEDNSSFAEVLKIMLSQSNYQQIKLAADYESAINIVNEFQPNIALLDIDLGGKKDGIDLANEINQSLKIPIIFITSNYNQSTYDRARKVGPYSFINKNISELTLKQAIELALSKHEQLAPQANEKIDDTTENLIMEDWYVRSGHYLRRIRFRDIEWIEVDGRTSFIITKEKRYAINISLKEVTEKLNKDNFQRIHHRYLINTDKIQMINIKNNEVIINDHPIPIGRSFRSAFLKNIQRII